MMRDNYKRVKLGEVVYPVSQTYKFAPNEKVIFINTGDILEGKFLHSNLSDSRILPGQAKKRIKKGDILFSEIRPANKRYAFVDFDADNYVVSTKLMVLRPNDNIDSQYLYIWLTMPSTLQNFQIIAESRSGTFPQITFDSIKNEDLSLPPLSEQKRIANILSSFDNKIEQLKKENNILENIAQSIFKEWFVKYNFPNNDGKPYRDSGGKMIDSELGLIPEGWRVLKIEDVCRLIASGGTPSTSKPEYYGNKYNWFTTKELNDTFLLSSEKKISEEGLRNSSAKIFPENSILIAIYASPTVGRLGILNEESTFNQAACGLDANELSSNEYLFLYLLNERSNLNNLSSGAAQQNLNAGIIKNYPIPIPDSSLNKKFTDIVEAPFRKLKSNMSMEENLTEQKNNLIKTLIK